MFSDVLNVCGCGLQININRGSIMTSITAQSAGTEITDTWEK